MDFLTCSSLSLLVLTCILLWLLHWMSTVWRSDLPPGPTPLPVIGNFHQMAIKGIGNLQQTLVAWGKRYGDVYTLHFGSKRVMVLNSYESIKEAFSLQVFEGRPHNFIADTISENLGLVFAEGQLWKEHRRFALSNLKDFGFGKIFFEEKILEEIETLLNHLEESNAQPFDIQLLLTNSVANIITSILWGQRYENTDETFQSYLQSVNHNIKVVRKCVSVDSVFPFLKNLPGDLLGFNKILAGRDLVENFLKDIIKSHRHSLDENNVTSFVDVFLLQIEKEKSNIETSFTEKQLCKVLGDLFVAGLETTSTTLRWIILYLVLHPEVQEKAQAEIDDVFGERKPSVRDRLNLPYIEAVILEAHRLGMVAFLGVAHAAVEDTVFRGFTVPKGTVLMSNMASVFLNENDFPDPTKFDPGRFLENNGKQAAKVIPFGIGRRVCIGESLARMELTLYLTSMLQRFTFSLPEGAAAPSTDGIQGGTYLPRPFQVCVKLRK